MTDNSKPIARQKGLVVQELADEVLVYDLDSNKAHCLNRSAALIWRTCDGTNSVSDMIGQFQLTGGGKVTEDFVWLAIDQLGEKGLLVSPLKVHFAGQSRRKVLKAIGLATLVTLPIIASLVTPPNVLGQINCACTSPGQCATMTTCPNLQFCNGAGICAPN